MADGLVVACHSVDTWRSKLQEAKTSSKLDETPGRKIFWTKSQETQETHYSIQVP